MKSYAIRKAYGETLAQLGEVRKDIIVLDADVSHSTQTYMFQEKYPDRFYNFGIAEANMICAGAGLATLGYIPIINSFSFLLSERGLDQLRSSIAYNNLDVKIAGNYGGMSDSFDGSSHHSLSDLSIINSIPNMRLVVLSDAVSTRKALSHIIDEKGPVYIRLCRAETPIIYDENYEFHFGKGVTLSSGEDLTIIATGVMVYRALEARKALLSMGVKARVIELHTLKPVDEEIILKAARETGAIVTCEEGNIKGGLAGIVSQVVAKGYPVPMDFVGVDDKYGESGEYEALLDAYGMSIADIVEASKKVFAKKGSKGC